MLDGVRVHYYRVHNPGYPRNRRIREYLTKHGASVTIAEPSQHRARLARLLGDIARLVRDARRADVIILSEMRLQHAGYVGVIGKLIGRPVVVDGFIGLHETEIGDWETSSTRSIRARILRLLDRIAIRAADIYLVDTEVRANRIRAFVPKRTVHSLPVGAPAWARPTDTVRVDGRLHVLYYGNYIPLHGLDFVLEALAAVVADRDIRATFIGDGPRRPLIQARAIELGLQTRITFREPVPEPALRHEIAAADIVLGIFGPSEKARSVIANKVWQGLACGRMTLTQRSAAVAEIAPAAGSLLVQTEPGNAESLAEALRRAPLAHGPASDIAEALEAVVRAGYDAFARDLAAVVSR
ncbi:glycosyltransferase [Curtobacterium sp. MCLR17_054]|uniref:glycosyltransferase n=1 Tax=Curtobacterium sp. MCLR17_054 TaxID=2175632 RepID=UPI000DA99BFF|nr:glycosyltransferase [Curtobacterium sp. MCLR17_054]WIE70303.1 glycosyltransferase [Curtobacterium sp. MCLR17_054]